MVVAMMVLVSFLDVELNGVHGMDNGVSLHAGHTHTHSDTHRHRHTHARESTVLLPLSVKRRLVVGP